MFRLKTKGFTLIELMIVVAIIGILAAIAIPKFAQMLEKSREGATEGQLGKSQIGVLYLLRRSTRDLAEFTLCTYSTYSFSKYMDNISAVKVTGASCPGLFPRLGTK